MERLPIDKRLLAVGALGLLVLGGCKAEPKPEVTVDVISVTPPEHSVESTPTPKPMLKEIQINPTHTPAPKDSGVGGSGSGEYICPPRDIDPQEPPRLPGEC